MSNFSQQDSHSTNLEIKNIGILINWWPWSGRCGGSRTRVTFFFFFFSFLSERVHEQGRGAEEQNLKQAPCSVQSLTQSLIPQPLDHDLSPNQESGPQQTKPCRHPRRAIFCHMFKDAEKSALWKEKRSSFFLSLEI